MSRSQNLLAGNDRGWCQFACRGHKQKNTSTAFLSIDPWRTIMFKGGVLERVETSGPMHRAVPGRVHLRFRLHLRFGLHMIHLKDQLYLKNRLKYLLDLKKMQQRIQMMNTPGFVLGLHSVLRSYSIRIRIKALIVGGGT